MVPASQHFNHNLQNAVCVLLLGRGVVALALDLFHSGLNRILALNRRHSVQIAVAHGKECTVILQGIIDLIPSQAQGRDHIRRCVRLGEHIFDFIAAVYVPLLHAHFFHGFLIRRQLLGRLALTRVFHDLKAVLLT